MMDCLSQKGDLGYLKLPAYIKSLTREISFGLVLDMVTELL
jgi:hypothetical protein